jgi:predicted nucleic acid-binding protein
LAGSPPAAAIGARMLSDFSYLQADLALWQGIILPITKAFSGRAVRLVEEQFLARHLQLADALIAATVVEHKLAIVTCNTKHYQSVKTLRIDAFRTH